MQVFVINLDHAKDRWQNIERQFIEKDFLPQRVSAIFGDDIKEKPVEGYLEDSYRRRHGKRTNLREVGCYRSHIKVLRQFLASNEPHALVAEDDIQIKGDLKHVVNQAVMHEQQWDLLRLSGLHKGTPIGIVDLNGSYQLSVNLSRQTGSGAYLINRMAASKIVDQLATMRLPYDHAFDREWCHGYRALSVTPYPITQNDRYPSQIYFEGKYGPMRYLTVFPYRAVNETLRVVHRLGQVARTRLTMRLPKAV